MPRLQSTLPIIATLALTALPQPGRAEPIDLGEIVVSADLTPTPANKVGATVDIVTREDLQKAAQGSVADALALVPGITIRPTGGVGAQTGLSIRGVSQNYIKVLVDGIDVTDPSGPQVAYDFGRLGTAGIGRIEVLKGSQSALYGGSAVGGVVSISSARSDKPGLHQYFEMRYGSRSTEALNYGLTLNGENSSLALNLSHVSTDGIVDYVGAGSGNLRNAFRSNRISLAGSHSFDNGVKIGFSAFHQNSTGHYDAGGVPGSIPAKSSGLRVYSDFETGAVRNTVAVTTYRIDRSYDSVWGSYRYVGTRKSLSYKGTAPISSAATLSFGLEGSRIGFSNSSGSPSSSSRWKRGAFTELAYSPTAQLDLSAALRYDNTSGVGGAPSARVAMAWRPQQDLTVRASAGTGFRNPSLYELSYAAPGVSLQREKSDSVDLGVEKRLSEDTAVSATAFWFSVRDAIYSTTVYPPTYRQGGNATRYGVELAGRTKLGKVSLRGAYTYTLSHADSSLSATQWGVAKYLPARHKISLEASAPVTAKLTAGLSILAAANRPGLSDYIVANADFTYDLGNDAKAYLRVENLTNASYQLVKDYATPGRSVYIGLRKEF
ncbi:TonB-dependent receptor plug domain-containing protein [Acidimangrovimonas pyrenivorans]|uniref:TonB-dependent receptor plug domain-containing protein n=1 Tax=Acidimangrovimonas pyrenivorans TaxID=2030798 RepID=A0ABV7AIF0_9RHOB